MKLLVFLKAKREKIGKIVFFSSVKILLILLTFWKNLPNFFISKNWTKKKKKKKKTLNPMLLSPFLKPRVPM
jgi:hypothetical protein